MTNLTVQDRERLKELKDNSRKVRPHRSGGNRFGPDKLCPKCANWHNDTPGVICYNCRKNELLYGKGK